MKAGAYVLDLYCDHPGCQHRAHYSADGKQETFQHAIKDGWYISKPWTAPDYCKKHKPEKK